MDDSGSAKAGGHAPVHGPRRVALIVFGVLLALLGIWILRGFLVPMLWAVVFAIATWPLYEHCVRILPGHSHGRLWAPTAFTLLTGLLVMVPFLLVAIETAHEAVAGVRFIANIERDGLHMPDSVARLPFVGTYIADWWQQNLSTPQSATRLLGRLDRAMLFDSARAVGGQLLLRSTDLVVTLLTLFFLYRSGDVVRTRLLVLADNTLGSAGRPLSEHLVSSVRGTVNGLVLVGLGEGLVLGVAYGLLGLPDPLLLSVLTGVLAVVPFGAFAVFGSASLVLLAQSGVVPALVLFGIGMAVLFVADHLARPILIGNAARLPFLWVLLGIIGGLESFGLLGLFLGPVIMAILMSLWRDVTSPSSSETA